MKTVRVRDIVIGEGIPKVCVPVCEKTKEEILREAKHIAGLEPDIVEFRADYFELYEDPDKLKEVLAGLRQALGDIPLLMTIRTAAEGGEADAADSVYADAISAACGSGMIDMVDIEALRMSGRGGSAGGARTKELIETAREKGVKVIASKHDFAGTPDRDEIVACLKELQDSGADIIKIAVMPQSRSDVNTLMSAAKEMADSFARCPIAAISMGDTGAISRAAAETFGSAITFGVASKQSAPGQMSVEDLKRALAFYHGTGINPAHIECQI